MDISAVIFATHRIRLLPDEGKIPWDEPAFSQRMLENHLSQDHDWASRRLTVIEQQVTWITRQLPAGARILDLGCGPGFYTRLLAERGFHCTGVDFSPASITWARQQAQAANLNIDYIQQDIRTYHPTEPFDFIMMTFGELNVFSAADAQSLISHCAQWLQPDGKLLVEVHTFDEVKRQGSHTWLVGETFAGKLFALLAEKASTSEGIALSKRNNPMDIPRIFTISESEHRIHNPFTAEKYATLGHALRMKPGMRILDLGSGSGEMLCTWARDYGVTGTGIDISPLFTTQAKQRAEELGVSEYVHFIHNDAAGYIDEEKYDVAACVGATWIAGGVAGTIDLLAKSLKPGGIILIGEPYWRQIPATEEIAHACGVSSVADFRPLPELVAFFDQLGYDVVEMVLADPQGWDRYEAAKWMTMRRWLEENPDDEFAQEVRTELTVAPKRHVTWTREYFGWGVFALIAR